MAENNKVFHFRMITPLKTVFDEKVDMVIFRSENGDMAVLPGHAPVTTLMGYGEMRVFIGEEEHIYSVLGGYATVDAKGLTVLTDAAERPDEIDYERAKQARESALRALREEQDEVDVRKAELALRRALVRMEVSAYPIIRGRHGDS